MKKLSKIKLHNIVEMTDNEMKKVVGGFGTEEPTGDSGGGGDTCGPTSADSCGGVCNDISYPIYDNKGKKIGERIISRSCRGRKPEGSDSTYIICGCA